MATLVLSAAGMALGGSIGGTVAGLSMAAIGRFAGATIGRSIDQRLMGGSGSAPVETGQIDRFRLTGASEGTPIPQLYGRMRMGGQIIWATQFQEHTKTTTSGGGKGVPSAPEQTTIEYSYTVSLAIAICEGVITRVGRVWADGQEISPDGLNMRVYKGGRDQQPDPKIAAVQGLENTPAFRGVAYVLMEDMPLAQFGNRIPQFNFEVTRPSEDNGEDIVQDLSHAVTSVAMMPGSGEYTLATMPVHYDDGFGVTRTANVNTASGKSDLETSLDALVDELPKAQSTSLIVSWFGDDLRCGRCQLKPKVEQNTQDADGMGWEVSGLARGDAELVPYIDDRPAYGGTPTDASVVEAIAELHTRGQDVLFYPFILMEQLADNTLTDPYSGTSGQPEFPWRGRITLDAAPNTVGTTDKSAASVAEVDAFFGAASATDFTVSGTSVTYTGPAEWSYRRFILHNAYLCQAAGGVAAFCIGSEMRGLTTIRGANHTFPAVQHLIALAANVRSILGPDTKISYAADWSEYFGYQPQDGSNDRIFHLDPLWADTNIDFIGIDNYMPLSDWRNGCDHADADAGAIYNLDYLMANVEGGEGFDWYYANDADRDAQIRTPIQDAGESEPWVFRYKDIRGWWENPHYNRIDGVRSLQTTPWVQESKPIWFTEIGCAAVDKGTNQPNKFLDPKSSESSLPRYSDGRRDELIQMQYLRAMYTHWTQAENNPVSQEYAGPMLDMTRAHVWAWDARPFPAFPDRLDVWSDGANYAKGHWLTGRTSARPLDSVVREICARSGVTDIDTSHLYGYVRGYLVSDVTTARAALQPLMLAHGFDAIEREGRLIFENRRLKTPSPIAQGDMVLADGDAAPVERTRQPQAELADRVRLNYVNADGSFEVAASEAIFPEYDTQDIAVSELNMSLLGSEARAIAERWLIEARVSRDTAKFILPPSNTDLGAGDVVSLTEAGGGATFRIAQVDVSDQRTIDAVRVEEDCLPPVVVEDVPVISAYSFTAALPVFATFMDLPLLRGDEDPYSPYVAVAAAPWPGTAAVYHSPAGSDYSLKTVFPVSATLGRTLTPLHRAQTGIIDHGPALDVEFTQGGVTSTLRAAMLNGANAAVIGDGTPDNWEVIQFETAEIIGNDRYSVTGRLRGQAGSDALMPDVWPAGSIFVLLNGVPEQATIPAFMRNVMQHYRIGPAQVALDDPSYRDHAHAFQGNGLRPLAPVWLRSYDSAGDTHLTWVRRDRLHADSWDLDEIPMSEAAEQYQVDVIQNGVPVRTAMILAPDWVYTAAMKSDDGVTGPVTIKVAQMSAIYGAGLARDITVSV